MSPGRRTAAEGERTYILDLAGAVIIGVCVLERGNAICAIGVRRVGSHDCRATEEVEEERRGR